VREERLFTNKRGRHEYQKGGGKEERYGKDLYSRVMPGGNQIDLTKLQDETDHDENEEPWEPENAPESRGMISTRGLKKKNWNQKGGSSRRTKLHTPSAGGN